MAFIVGKKIGMTRVFKDDGTATPVTLVQFEQLKATQIRTKEQDGYEATQFSFKIGKKEHRQEFKVTANVGDTIDATAFKEGDIVKVTATSKAKGFQGAVKRHGFAGAPASHGHHHVLRHVGSIGQRFPQHTLKGLRMAGRMGGVRTTVRGLQIIAIDIEKRTIALKGAVPGRRGAWLTVQTLDI